MPDAFDPYHRWLAIPPEEQPPTAYRLLGLKLFEADADVIASAADRQMAHLRTFQAGPHGDLSQRLLNEVASAKLCLLSAEKRARYDAMLQARHQATQPGQAPETPTVAAPWRPRPVMMIGVGAGIGLMAVVGLLALWLGSGDQVAQDPDGPTAATEPVVPPPPPPPPVHRAASGSDTQGPARSPAEAAKLTTETESRPGDPADKTAPTETITLAKQPGESSEATPKIAEETAEASSSARSEVVKRLAVPDQDEQAAVAKDLAEIYDFSATKTSAAKLKLSGDLYEMGRKSGGKPAERFVLLRKSTELAADAGDAEAMFRAIDAMAADFEVDALKIKAKMLAKFAADPGRIDVVMTPAEALIDDAVEARQYDLALEVASLAERVSKRPGGAKFRKEVADRKLQIQKLADEHQKVQEAVTALEKDPKDRQVSLRVGRYYCFVEGDWDRGLPLLAAGSDEALAALAKQDRDKQPTAAAEQVELGDMWWDLAQGREGTEKDGLLLRAGWWYRKAEGQSPEGLLKAKIAKRLGEIAKVEAPAPRLTGKSSADSKDRDSILAGQWVEVLKPAEALKGRVSGFWSQERDEIRSGSGMWSRLMLPVSVDGSYDLEVAFTRTGGGDAVAVICPVGSRAFSLVLDGQYGKFSGLGLIDGLDHIKNATTKAGKCLMNDRKYYATLRVRPKGEQVAITVTLDGKPFLRWTGRQASLDVGRWSLPQAGHPGIGAKYSMVTFHSARLRVVSGTAKWEKPTTAMFAGADPASGSSPTVGFGPSTSSSSGPSDSDSTSRPWIDVLKYVDVDKDQVAGKWQRSGADLAVEAGEYSRLMLPVTPLGDYELEVAFSRNRATTGPIAVICPIGSSAFSAMLNTSAPARATESTGGAGTADSTAPRRMSRTYLLLMRVVNSGGQASVTGWVDGRSMINWSGDPAALGVPASWNLSNIRRPAIGSHNMGVTFQSVRLRMLSGTASLLRLSKDP